MAIAYGSLVECEGQPWVLKRGIRSEPGLFSLVNGQWYRLGDRPVTLICGPLLNLDERFPEISDGPNGISSVHHGSGAESAATTGESALLATYSTYLTGTQVERYEDSRSVCLSANGFLYVGDKAGHCVCAQGKFYSPFSYWTSLIRPRRITRLNYDPTLLNYLNDLPPDHPHALRPRLPAAVA